MFRGSDHHISAFLSAAALCTPRVLSIQICTNFFVNLPGSIFTCASVEEMSLEVKFDYDEDFFIEAESINLPHLKKMELGSLNINGDFIKMLLSGCPVLEEVVFSNCLFKIDEIACTVLKKLTFKECWQLSNMQISCPGVVSLAIESCIMDGITLKNMSSLVSTKLYLQDLSFDYEMSDLKPLSGLSSVPSLELYISPPIMDLLAADIPNCPTLHHLKSLVLGELAINLHWNLVACLVQHSPNLKTLTLVFSLPNDYGTEEVLPLGVPFQLEYLETLKIRCKNKTAIFVGGVVHTLDLLVKSIGQIIILKY